jgi:hypothetical protein
LPFAPINQWIRVLGDGFSAGKRLVALPACVDIEPSLFNLAANDCSLDLRSSFPNTIYAHISVETLDWTFAHIAPPAHDLEGLVDYPSRHFGAEQL